MKVKHSGFALIEVIIAIVVLSSVLAGATSLIWSAATAVERNQNRLTATYLAQECLELARNARDTAWRQHLPWDCAFQDFPIEQCSDIAGPIQEMMDDQEPLNRVYILGEETKFSRVMSIENETATEATIQCEVSWPQHSGTGYISLHEILTNWRKI